MGCFGKCACGDCCIEEDEMPYTTATLKSPDKTTCPSGPGVDPDPTEAFVRGECCYTARFELPCQSIQNRTCALFAKQTADFSFDAVYYQPMLSYNPAGIYDSPEDFSCPCIAVQKRTVEVQSAARIFFEQYFRLEAVSIHVGKMRIKCDGDANPVCKFYIAATSEYRVHEGISQAQYSSVKTISCTGIYRDGNCSITNSWTEEDGVNSDTCPEDISFAGSGTLMYFTRIKFYDSLPAAGDVTIASTDHLPFDCCSGKTNCTITQLNCGISIDSNCLPPVAPWIQGEQDNSEFRLVPCPGSTCGTRSEPVYFDEESNQYVCYSPVVNGYKLPSQTQLYDVFIFNGVCYDNAFDVGQYCVSQGVGFDRFGKPGSPPGELNGVNGAEWSTMCETAIVDACEFNPSQGAPGEAFYAQTCEGGDDPPLPGLCETGDCCQQLLPGGGISITNCKYLNPGYCGLKFENFECDAVRTDYTVGNNCVPIPNVTVGLA